MTCGVMGLKMARRRKTGQPINGWIILDKPAGMTSASAVEVVRRRLDAQKAGHAGTLDPLATGVLPIALGEATKTLPYVVDSNKSYQFTLRWGVATVTEDEEGETTEKSSVRPSQAEIEDALSYFIGEIEQVPPIYSAIKVGGERAYDIARRGDLVVLAPRRIWIESFRLLKVLDLDRAVFTVVSGKGAYMRSLARDFARYLGTVGHIAQLRRTAVAGFSENDAISLDELDGFGQCPAALEVLLPIETALDDIPALALTEQEAARLRTGQVVPLLKKTDLERSGMFGDGETVLATVGGKPVALTKYSAGEVRPVRVLNL